MPPRRNQNPSEVVYNAGRAVSGNVGRAAGIASPGRLRTPMEARRAEERTMAANEAAPIRYLEALPGVGAAGKVANTVRRAQAAEKAAQAAKSAERKATQAAYGKPPAKAPEKVKPASSRVSSNFNFNRPTTPPTTRPSAPPNRGLGAKKPTEKPVSKTPTSRVQKSVRSNQRVQAGADRRAAEAGRRRSDALPPQQATPRFTDRRQSPRRS